MQFSFHFLDVCRINKIAKQMRFRWQLSLRTYFQGPRQSVWTLNGHFMDRFNEMKCPRLEKTKNGAKDWYRAFLQLFSLFNRRRKRKKRFLWKNISTQAINGWKKASQQERRKSRKQTKRRRLEMGSLDCWWWFFTSLLVANRHKRNFLAARLSNEKWDSCEA